MICELDKNDLLPRVREARAAMVTAEAAVASAKADYERNKVDAAGPDLPFLKRDMERARSLATQGLDRPQRPRRSREAVRDGATTGSNRPSRIWQSAKASIAKAEAAARPGAGRARPLGGRSAQRDHRLAHRRRGAVARPRRRRRGQLHSGERSSATSIMTIGNLSEVYVKGKVDESDLGKIYIGQPARISVESFKDQKFAGKVTMISPMGVEKDNVTTFEVRVSISNESGKLRAQMTANAEIMSGREEGRTRGAGGRDSLQEGQIHGSGDTRSRVGEREHSGLRW